MSELDEIWERAIREAAVKSQAAGRSDVADYLTLKASNDQIRAAGCRWLFDSFLELSETVNKQGIRLDIENENPHGFAAGSARMVGSLLCFRCGVRALTVEAGWTRTPDDGFMRGGALARARITHFGMTKSNAELMLIQPRDIAPKWVSIEADGTQKPFADKDLNRHFQIFTGANSDAPTNR